MHSVRRFCEMISVMAVLVLAGQLRADETLVYPLDLEHSACPEEAFVAATEKSSQSLRRFTSTPRVSSRLHGEGILTMQENEDRPARRAYRGSRLRNAEMPTRDESPVQRTPRVWRAESKLEEVEGGFFPLLPYFQAADDADRDGDVQLAGFLEAEPTTCPAEETLPLNCDEDCPQMLPGEAAREILAIRKKMGAALGGTAFDADESELAADPDAIATRAGAIKYLVEYIRLLERQESELAHETFEIAIEPCETPAQDRTCSTPEAREALRDAAEKLDAAANVLERTELFARADELRRTADSLRQQARGVATTRCGTRAMRPTVRTGPACSEVEDCPARSTCPANSDHQSITWIPTDDDSGAVRTFNFENWPETRGTRPNLPIEQAGPWWSFWNPAAGPCGAGSGIRVGMPPALTHRDTIRFAPREASPRETWPEPAPHDIIERLPPIVEGQTPSTPRGIPSRSSFDAISEALQIEQEVEKARALRAQRVQDRIESELLRREIEELGQLTEDAARRDRTGQSQGKYDAGALRREVSRIRRQLETPGYR